MAANLPDLETLIQAGINPKTGLPYKFGTPKACLKDNIKHNLRILDEQDAVNRYVWYNLPANLTSQELERMIYYKGQLCLFYDKNLEEFYFMPYALDGTIDFYGRYNTVHPVPMTSGTEDKNTKAQAEYLSKIKLDCLYGLKLPEKPEDLTTHCVLLYDYSKQLSQNTVPRAQLQDSILDTMSSMIPYLNTSLLLSTGIEGVRINDPDQSESVEAANRSMEHAALTGEAYVPIVGNIDFQELSSGNVGKSEEYLLALQSLDNFRLSLYGIDNGGLFEKKAQELQSEADLNGGPVGLVMEDGLAIRQNFCLIADAYFGLDIWCEPSETITKNLTQGPQYNENDGSNSGVEPEDTEDTNNVE